MKSYWADSGRVPSRTVEIIESMSRLWAAVDSGLSSGEAMVRRKTTPTSASAAHLVLKRGEQPRMSGCVRDETQLDGNGCRI
jgi:hypothetical protein